MDVRRRPRPAIHAVRRAVDPLRLASGDHQQYGGHPGEDDRHRRLSRRRSQRCERRAHLVGDHRLCDAAAQLAAALQPADHPAGPSVCAWCRRQAVDAQRWRRGHWHVRAARLLWRRPIQRQSRRVRRQRLYQHAGHRRRAGQSLLRLPGDGSESRRAGERHRPGRAEWHGYLGRRGRGGRRSFDPEAGAQLRAGPLERRHHRLYRGEPWCDTRDPERRPARAQQHDARDARQRRPH